MTQRPLTTLLVKEVDRKEFLMYVGAIFLTVIGVTGILKSITSLTRGVKQEKDFGGEPYGQ